MHNIKNSFKIFYRTESESIERLKKLNKGEEGEVESSVGETDPFGEPEETSDKADEDEDEGDDDETNAKPISGEIDDMCRGDDKFRCGSSSVFICEVQKCDGVKNCPDGEDEENCPANEITDDGSGDEETVKEETSVEPEVETPGDFFVLLFSKFL